MSGIPDAPASLPVISSGTWDASLEACRQIVQRHARSFYFASRFLPRGKSEAAYAVYAFCRYVDDAVDLAADEAAVTAALDGQRTLLDDLERGETRGLPWAHAFVATWRWAKIPRRYFEDLLTGMRLDHGPVRIESRAELERYCYHVAGVVGLIMTHVFLHDPEESLLAPAAELGTAMQWTNILRDVGEDYARNRVYLPAETLAAHGVTEADLAAQKVTPGFRALMRAEIAHARELYRRAEPGMARLPNDGTRRTVWTMREVYAGILDRIEAADYDVFTRRARVGPLRKAALAWRAWRKSRA